MDYQLERWINAGAGGLPARDFLMIAVASGAEVVFLVTVVLWFILGVVRGRPDDRVGAIAALLASGLALLVNQVVSHIVYRPRPFVMHPNTVHVLLGHSADGSFPSDHAAAAVAISIVLCAFHRRLGIAALLFAVLTAYARVYVGDHYPGDVLAGALIGLLAGLVLVTWLRLVPTALGRFLDRLAPGKGAKAA
jgi:undecaprenyl-diphosphatase